MTQKKCQLNRNLVNNEAMLVINTVFNALHLQNVPNVTNYKKLYLDFCLSYNRSFLDTSVRRMVSFYRKNTEMVIRRENSPGVHPKHVERSHVPEGIETPKIFSDCMSNSQYTAMRETLVDSDFKSINWSRFLMESLPMRTLRILHTMGLADDDELRASKKWADAALKEIESSRSVASNSTNAEAEYIWYKEDCVENLRMLLVDSALLPYHETLVKLSQEFDSISSFCDLLHDVTLLAECRPIMADDLLESEKTSPFFEKFRFFIEDGEKVEKRLKMYPSQMTPEIDAEDESS